MILKDIKNIIGTSREVHAKDGQWVSRRMLLKDEGMGFSFHETIIKANTKTHKSSWITTDFILIYRLRSLTI